MRPGTRSVAAAAVCLLCAGCVQESNAGAMQSFAYELWVPLAVVLAGLASIPVGLLLRLKDSGWSWIFLIGGPLLAIVFAPTFFLERVDVTPDRFTVRSGIWGMTAANDVEFADVVDIRLTSKTTVTRRGGRQKSYYIECRRRNGEVASVGINNAVTQAAAPAILQVAAARGIPIADATGDR